MILLTYTMRNKQGRNNSIELEMNKCVVYRVKKY